jgi:hypothetical protein
MRRREHHLEHKELKDRVHDTKALMAAYNNTFNTPDGLIVLADILHKTGVFSVNAAENQQAMALRNFGANLLSLSMFTMPDIIGEMVTIMLAKAKKIDDKTIDAHIETLITGGNK